MSTLCIPSNRIKSVLYTVFLSFIGTTAFGQQSVVVDSEEYQQLKQTGGLNNVQVQPVSIDASGIQINPEYFSSGTVRTSDCDCYQQPDASYTLAMGPNDDGSSAQITLPFQFCFYGEQRTTLHINNNGNVSFAGPIATFSANAFPSNGNVMVAPFWGDVDTRGIGQVWYKITPTAIYVNWENVGYYNMQTDKTNTFQLILTNGADPAVPDGGNIAFCYRDMQWTTGSASQGVNGFGGVPATVGANRGNNVNFFQIGRFDHPGTDYNGATIPSGISWLDYKTFYFDICNSTNVPPIASGVAACDTFKICALGDTADFIFTFLSPELNQTTTLTFDNGGNPDIFMVNATTGNTAEIVIRAIGSAANAGYHTVSITATDDGTPTGVTTITFVIQIDDSAADLLNPQLSQPQASCSAIPVSVLNGPFDSYLWDDLTSFPTNTVSETGTFGVTVSLNGCHKRVEADFEIYEPAFFNLQGVPFVCPGVAQGTFMYAGDSLSLNSMTWGLSDPQLNQLFSNYLFEGTYNLNLVDTNGCVRDTVLTIGTQPKIVLSDYSTYCMDSHALTGNVGVNTGSWYTINSPSGASFASNNLNTTITVTQSGTYTLVYAEDHCNDSDTTTIIFVDPRPFGFDSDFHICPGEIGEFLAVADSSNYVSITWGLSNPVLNAQFSNTLQEGTYTVSKLDAFGCANDTTFTITTQPKIVLAQYGVICNDTLSLFQNTGVNTGSWSTIPSGFNLNFQSNEVNTMAIAGQYGTVQIIYSENVCNDADTTTVEFNRPPYTQILDSMLCAGTVYQMYALNYPQNANYVWSTGETGTLMIAVDQPGEYFVSVTNSCGTHSDTATVVYITCDFEVPNVFTPNGDGTNDFFKLVEFQGLKNFNIVILNRWGNVMREFSDPDFQWDGTDKNGNPVTEGVYFYRVQTETFNGQPLEKHGFVQLIRD
jgi:gliding motility-associated-like protein